MQEMAMMRMLMRMRMLVLVLMLFCCSGAATNANNLADLDHALAFLGVLVEAAEGRHSGGRVGADGGGGRSDGAGGDGRAGEVDGADAEADADERQPDDRDVRVSRRVRIVAWRALGRDTRNPRLHREEHTAWAERR